MKIQSAYIEITNICNLNCVTCYNQSGINKKRNELSIEQIEDIILKLQNYGCNNISLAGGEPCLHSKFDNILLFTTKFPIIHFDFATNGTIFDKILLDTYGKVDNLNVQISLDGSCENINAKTRGKGNYEKSIKLADELLKSKKPLLIKMVISKLNYTDIESFYRLVIEKGAIPEFAFINCNGNGKNNWENKYIDSKQKFIALKLIDELNKEYGTKARLPLCTSDCPLDDLNSPKSIAIKVDGSIQPCQLLYGDKFTVCNALSFTDEELQDGFNRVAQMVATRKNTDYGCSRCILRNHCKKGCMAIADYSYDNYLGSDGECEYRKLQFLGYNIKDQIIKETANV